MLANSSTVEFATTTDAAEIARLSRRYIEYGLRWRYTPSRISYLISNKSKNVVVARGDAGLLGFGIMTYGMENANLDLLAVREGHRRQGVGRRIMLWLEKVALTAGIANIYLQARESNNGALRFYRKLGFQAIEKLPGYYQRRESCVVMCKGLRSMIAPG